MVAIWQPTPNCWLLGFFSRRQVVHLEHLAKIEWSISESCGPNSVFEKNFEAKNLILGQNFHQNKHFRASARKFGDF
jgi:hypothetical protein